MATAHACLVCYDIADPKRLNRVHRFMMNAGVPVQYSVFTAVLTPRQQRQLMADLEILIDPSEDDIRLYPLSDRLVPVTLGQLFFPDGVMLLRDGKDLLHPGDS
jgi:CRISPR-associated protein Cas2